MRADERLPVQRFSIFPRQEVPMTQLRGYKSKELWREVRDTSLLFLRIMDRLRSLLSG